MSLNYACFQLMRHDLCIQHEARLSKTLKYRARMRERDANLKAYLNTIADTVHQLKQTRSIYY
jgi:hypothetical protein